MQFPNYYQNIKYGKSVTATGRIAHAEDMRQEKLEKNVVIKYPKTESTSQSEIKLSVEAIKSEIAILKILKNKHPAICNLTDEGTYEEGNGTVYPFFAMKEAPPLYRVSDFEKIYRETKVNIGTDNLFPENIFLNILIKLAEVIGIAHENNIVNHDLKIDHLFWRHTDKHLWLIDWGNAKNLDSLSNIERILNKKQDIKQFLELTLHFYGKSLGQGDALPDSLKKFKILCSNEDTTMQQIKKELESILEVQFRFFKSQKERLNEAINKIDINKFISHEEIKSLLNSLKAFDQVDSDIARLENEIKNYEHQIAQESVRQEELRYTENLYQEGIRYLQNKEWEEAKKKFDVAGKLEACDYAGQVSDILKDDLLAHIKSQIEDIAIKIAKETLKSPISNNDDLYFDILEIYPNLLQSNNLKDPYSALFFAFCKLVNQYPLNFKIIDYSDKLQNIIRDLEEDRNNSRTQFIVSLWSDKFGEVKQSLYAESLTSFINTYAVHLNSIEALQNGLPKEWQNDEVTIYVTKFKHDLSAANHIEKNIIKNIDNHRIADALVDSRILMQNDPHNIKNQKTSGLLKKLHASPLKKNTCFFELTNINRLLKEIQNDYSIIKELYEIVNVESLRRKIALFEEYERSWKYLKNTCQLVSTNHKISNDSDTLKIAIKKLLSEVYGIQNIQVALDRVFGEINKYPWVILDNPQTSQLTQFYDYLLQEHFFDESFDDKTVSSGATTEDAWVKYFLWLRNLQIMIREYKLDDAEKEFSSAYTTQIKEPVYTRTKDIYSLTKQIVNNNLAEAESKKRALYELKKNYKDDFPSLRSHITDLEIMLSEISEIDKRLLDLIKLEPTNDTVSSQLKSKASKYIFSHADYMENTLSNAIKDYYDGNFDDSIKNFVLLKNITLKFKYTPPNGERYDLTYFISEIDKNIFGIKKINEKLNQIQDHEKTGHARNYDYKLIEQVFTSIMATYSKNEPFKTWNNLYKEINGEHAISSQVREDIKLIKNKQIRDFFDLLLLENKKRSSKNKSVFDEIKQRFSPTPNLTIDLATLVKSLKNQSSVSITPDKFISINTSELIDIPLIDPELLQSKECPDNFSCSFYIESPFSGYFAVKIADANYLQVTSNPNDFSIVTPNETKCTESKQEIKKVTLQVLFFEKKLQIFINAKNYIEDNVDFQDLTKIPKITLSVKNAEIQIIEFEFNSK